MKGRLVEDMQDVLKRASVNCRIHLDAHRVTLPDHSCLTRCANVPRQAFVRSLKLGHGLLDQEDQILGLRCVFNKRVWGTLSDLQILGIELQKYEDAMSAGNTAMCPSDTTTTCPVHGFDIDNE